MKTNHPTWLSAAASLLTVGMLITSGYTSAGQQQPDSVVGIVADGLGLPFLSADQRPLFGTYFDIRSSLPCVSGPLPFPPVNANLPVYAISDHQFLVDQTGGQVLSPLPPEYGGVLSAADAAAVLQAQVAELQDFVARIQARLLSSQMATLDADSDPEDDPYYDPFADYSYGTNDLWLQIVSGPVTNATADLVIHPPWDVTNGVYDLLYCTSIAPPVQWQWVLRSDPGQTNLSAPAPDGQGFYKLSTPDDLTATSSLGTNFWVMFYPMDSNSLVLFISSPVGATGTLTAPGLAITNVFSVAAGSVATIDLSAVSTNLVNPNFDAKATNGIHITASQPVSVYGFNSVSAGRAAFTAYPTPMLGTNYCLMARPSYASWLYGINSSEFAILAIEDSTTVTITPSASADLIGDHGTNYQVNLDAGESYQTWCNSDTDDVTGTLISSDKPIAVFAGATLAYVPDWYQYYANPLVQQQLPVESWGKHALALSFGARLGGDSFRVLAVNDNTIILTNGVVAGTNQAREFLDLIIDGPVEFQATQPFQAAQFAQGTFADNQPGDPCETLLPPVGHYLKTNVVWTPPNEIIEFPSPTNLVTIIVAQSAISTTWVDNSTVDATNFVAIGNSGYYGARLGVAPGTHTVTSSQPVGVQVYGFDTVDAYSYFSGVVK